MSWRVRRVRSEIFSFAMRRADYRYYREHGLFDFPQKDWKTGLFNMFVTPLMAVPSFREEVQGTMKERMVEPLRKVVEREEEPPGI